MVTKWGLSEKMGPLSYGEEEGEIFLGGTAVSRHKEISDRTAAEIDAEIRSIIDQSYAKAKQVLQKNDKVLHAMAEALMQYETIDTLQLKAIMAGKTPPPPADWSAHDEKKTEDSSDKLPKQEASEVKKDAVSEKLQQHDLTFDDSDDQTADDDSSRG